MRLSARPKASVACTASCRARSSRCGSGPGDSSGGGEAEVKPGAVIVRVDPRYYRPTEVSTLLGDATTARQRLGWSPAHSFRELVREMVREDLSQAQRIDVLRAGGFAVQEPQE